ncbi:MAG: phenylalanine--tRNA ligase subunit beta [Oscillospiraceae bacterium]|jgi:phenylalanyl-tRNA synthetase beta chain|nr:phenylalanine--tRNA ligase subunit beta [Oscillospiraceae bacterium]
MLLPISWLKSLVDLEGVSSETIENGLFSCGLEVEEKKPFAPDISGVVVGKITSTRKHEDSDHLTVCTLDCGQYGSGIQIVTGAGNIKTGDTVPVALHGATALGRDGEKVTIKNGKLRGVASNGMLCSGEELGIDDDWYEGAGVDGILILSEDVPPGTDIKAYLELDDEIWDIDVTANLPHCQYVYGVAREFAALIDRPLKEPDLSYEATDETDERISVRVDAPDLCPRYIGHQVKNVKIAPSPRWMRRRLLLCGHKPFNNIVDITNYVLTEMGQPMHAFDMANVAGAQIIVRRAENSEKIVTLDEAEFTLTNENLVICDKDGPVALAGIMGGLNSGIAATTNEVLFEAAKFMRGNIRRTSRALGQSSDSSRRFEKGVDEYTTGLAMRRALHLVNALGCGTVTATHIDVYAEPDKKKEPIVTTVQKINSVLGIEIPKDTIVSILRRMAYEVDVNGETISAVAPAYREDIEDFPDLAEDVIKMYGYQHIKPYLMQNAAITAGGMNKKQLQTERLKHTLVAQGYYELINYSFYSMREIDSLNLPSDAPEYKTIQIMNPLSEKYSVMRTTLAPSMLNIISHNLKKGNEEGRFFELATVFTPKQLPVTELPYEVKKLCFGLFGKEESFFTAKGAVEALGQEFGLAFTYQRVQKPFLHPGAAAEVFLGEESIGYFGQLSYEVAGNFEISQNAYIGELNYEKLSAHFVEIQRYAPIAKHPEIKRDLALIANEETTCGEIEAMIESTCKFISAVRLFDIYRSAQIGSNKKSMAFSLVFTPKDEPLSPEKLDSFVGKILQKLETQLGITIR